MSVNMKIFEVKEREEKEKQRTFEGKKTDP